MTNKVKFKIGEIEFEAEGSPEILERERTVFMNSILPAAVEALVQTKPVNQPVIIPEQPVRFLPEETKSVNDNISISECYDFSKTSLVSYLKSKGADSHYDFIVCSMYFEQKRNGITSFSSKTIKELYAEAKKPTPGNLSMSLSELVKKGLIMEDPSEKGKKPIQYVLTSDGELFVETLEPSKDLKPKKSVTKTHKTKGKIKSKYASINIDELNLKKYPDIKLLNGFKEKMMLLLYIVVKENKGDSFSVVDIQCLLTDLMGQRATEKQIRGVLDRNKQWFKIESDENNKKAYSYKLLQGGKDFAENIIKSKTND